MNEDIKLLIDYILITEFDNYEEYLEENPDNESSHIYEVAERLLKEYTK